MKESIRAAREEVAHDGLVSDLRELAHDDDEGVGALEDLKAQRMPGDVRAMTQLELLRGIVSRVRERHDALREENAALKAELEALRENTADLFPSATSITPEFLTTEQRESLVAAGYHSDEAIAAAPRRDLEALPHVGEATVDRLYEAFGVESREEPPVPSAVLDGDTYALLSESGYDTHQSIVGAPDEDLLAIKGIGEATLKEIREKVGGTPDGV